MQCGPGVALFPFFCIPSPAAVTVPRTAFFFLSPFVVFEKAKLKRRMVQWNSGESLAESTVNLKEKKLNACVYWPLCVRVERGRGWPAVTHIASH